MSAAADAAWKDRGEGDAEHEDDQLKAAKAIQQAATDACNLYVAQYMNGITLAPKFALVTVQLSVDAPERIATHMANAVGVDLTGPPFREHSNGIGHFTTWLAPHVELTVVTTRQRKDMPGGTP